MRKAWFFSPFSDYGMEAQYSNRMSIDHNEVITPAILEGGDIPA